MKTVREISNCCKADIRVREGTTQFYICEKCSKPCDIVKEIRTKKIKNGK